MTVAFELPALWDQLKLAALEVSTIVVPKDGSWDRELTGARFVDGLRDAGAMIPSVEAWEKMTDGFSLEAWQRLEVLVRVFRHPAFAPRIGGLLKEDSHRIGRAFPLFCVREAQLLTIELLLKSTFRLEELARKWVAALGATIAGEEANESRQKMERLDFGGVLKSLQAADADRSTRMKKLKEIEAARLKAQQEAYERAGRE